MAPADQRADAGGRVLLYLPWEFDMLGGVDVVVDRLWRGLETRRPGDAIIGIQDWSRPGSRIDSEGRHFLHLNLPAPPPDNAVSLRYVATLIRRLPVVLRELQVRKIKLVNFHFPTLNAFPLSLLKRMGLWRGRIVLSFHGSDVAAIDARSPRWKRIAAEANAVTACSRALADRVDKLGIFQQATQVVHNGIDGEHFLAKHGVALRHVAKPFILNVGNYIPRKAQDVLLEAFARVAPEYPDLRLVCIGGTDNGRWLSHLNELAARLGISQRVDFLENQPQSHVASLMREAACLAHSANDEPFGLVVIEAGACGAPVIATRVGGIAEIVSSPELGKLIEPGDSAALANAIKTVIDDPVNARAMAERFKAHIARQFSVDAMTLGYLSHFGTLSMKYQP
jgi:glycosyltransferase involved in cell wall biosynthesis